MPPTSPTPVNRDEAPPRAAVRESVQAPLRERGDACPGALRLHAADDGRLARLRLPAGLLTVRQAETLADAAERLGDGHLDLTSRGNVQLRGLDEGCGPELAGLLHEAGLLPSETHERVRNIVASPLAGLDEPAGLDKPPYPNVQLWARELDGLLCASARAATLSGRFLFALDDGRGDVAALGADVTLLAHQDGSVVVRTGANRPGLCVAPEDAPRAALLAAETFLTLAEAGGSGAWRVRELPAEDGRELDAALRAALADAGIATRGVAEATTPDLEGEPPLPGPVRSPDGTVALSVHARLGRLTVAQWRLLAAAANGPLRVTPWRGVIVPGVAPAMADAVLDRLRTAGLVTDPGSPWYGVGACTGRPGCAKALADVRSDATAAALSRPGSEGLPVYWSGCARRCGHPQGRWVDVVATGEGRYDISVQADARPVTTTPRPGPGPQPRPGPEQELELELADAVAAARTTPLTR
ncbi:precorrin-3B synthase [Streptomyces sp. 35G-GA-8]|uniref:precorrin-3B synthase n=1 Tax=Streptomyces sp. 35G-GA-8 TaxID=2939434 RepID=UPI00201F762B|nr:precorrin-3B synthase [Streptomyces sp. 35G-GA-8]MCL7376455.1 precorrin-3B synthase [Streptomyces sp. 35G-GA-8]